MWWQRNRDFVIGAMILIVVAFFLFLAASVARAHSWYSGLTNAAGLGCCGVSDCGPVEHRYVDGVIELLIRGDWWPIDQSVLLPDAAPDGRWHACQLTSDPAPRCVIPPGGEV